MKMKKIEDRKYREEEYPDIYTEEGIQELIDNDEMMNGEAGFMNGYLEDEEAEEEEIV